MNNSSRLYSRLYRHDVSLDDRTARHTQNGMRFWASWRMLYVVQHTGGGNVSHNRYREDLTNGRNVKKKDKGKSSSLKNSSIKA